MHLTDQSKDHEERRPRPEGRHQRPNRTKGANHPDKPTHRGKLLPIIIEQTWAGRQGQIWARPEDRDIGNTNQMACQDRLGTEKTSRAKEPPIKRRVRENREGGRWARQNQGATTAYLRNLDQRKIGGPRIQLPKTALTSPSAQGSKWKAGQRTRDRTRRQPRPQ